MRPREFVLGHSTILPAIWSRLGKVRAFATVFCNGGFNGQVIGHLEGEASPKLDAESSYLRIEEHGRISLGHDEQSYAASNVYCWRLENDGLALDYDRSNGRRLVSLVVFKPISATVLESETPHHCGPDCYRAWLEIMGGTVVLRWQITGPNKNYALKTHYMPSYV